MNAGGVVWKAREWWDACGKVAEGGDGGLELWLLVASHPPPNLPLRGGRDERIFWMLGVDGHGVRRWCEFLEAFAGVAALFARGWRV